MTAPQNIPAAGKIGTDDQQARNRTHSHYTQQLVGDGVTTFFALLKTPANVSQIMVYVAGLRLIPSDRGTPNDYTVNGSTITLTVAPVNGVPITFDFVSS
jgi:hypothetical protein